MTPTATREDHDALYRLIMAGWGSQVVRTLALFDVPEHLEAQPLTADDIAALIHADPHSTYRLLRAATSLGLLTYDTTSRLFDGTAMLDVLRTDSALSLKHYAQIAASEVFWLPSLRLPETVLDGRNHAEDVLGCSPFQYFGNNGGDAKVFGSAMTELSRPVITEAVSAIDIGTARTVVDVGGADGAFVGALLEVHTHLAGVVLDLPQATTGAVEEAQRRGLTDRMNATPGDFFNDIPPADIYLLKFILHDWDDGSCRRILTNIRRAMAPEARLVVVEMITDTDSIEASMMDIAMMFAFTGQERDESHLTSLLTSAGLNPSRSVRLHKPYLLIEAQAI